MERGLHSAARAGLGQLDPIEQYVGRVAGSIVDRVMPKIEPAVRRMVREDILPKAGLYAVVSLLAVGAGAAFIGAKVARG